MNNSCKKIGNKCCEDSHLSNLSDILSIISQENRLQILCLLNKNNELCVCEIIEILWLKQNLVSHHLMILKNIWLLKRRKDWKQVFYSINKDYYSEIIEQIKIIFNIN